jgi:hypothetical protein
MPMPPFDVKALGNSIMSFISTDDKNQVRGFVFAQTEDPPPPLSPTFFSYAMFSRALRRLRARRGLAPPSRSQVGRRYAAPTR